MKFKDKKIKDGKNYGDEYLKITDLEDTKKCYILVSNYGEVTGCSLNKTQVKSLISALKKWIIFQEQRK